jgi:exosortase/archaeosortase family protein
VPTDTRPGRTDAVRFVLRAVAWSLGLFGLLRLNWTEAHILLPFTRLQAAVAAGVFVTPALPVQVTLACSGADAFALCLGAVLAYPVPWDRRLAGAAGGAGLILGLNTLRIATLGRVAAFPSWFHALHVYVWPAVLTLAIAGYVLGWMRFVDRRRTPGEHEAAPRGPFLAAHPLSRLTTVPAGMSKPAPLVPQPSRRFVLLTIAFLLLFAAGSPLYLESPAVLALSGFIARSAAVTLGIVGISAHAAANVLWTPRGGFTVTQECISTPLIPVYLAAICAYSTTWRRLILGVLATPPIFIVLGVVRLLVVALPGVVASPMFFVHAFYQLLLGAVVVFLAALWRHGGRGALGHALVGVIVGVLFVRVFGPLYTPLVNAFGGAPIDDPQGAIAFLPAFQVGLYLALSVAAFAAFGWGRFLAGLAVLGLTQTAGLLALHALAGHAGLMPHVRDVRGWAVAGPVLIFVAVVNVARTRR